MDIKNVLGGYWSMLIEIFKPDFEFVDNRGKLTQLVNKGFNQINVIESLANVNRGGHYHKFNKEAFYIVKGKLALTVRMNDIEEKYEFEKGDMFLINAFVSHSFQFLTDTLLISMYDKGVVFENGEKDIYIQD